MGPPLARLKGPIQIMTRRHRLSTALLLTAAALSGPAAAQEVDHARKYAECMKLADTRPGDAWDYAGQWLGLAGGEPARHCAAVALIGLKEYREAANRLEMLATTSRGTEALRAEMLAQAAQAWLLFGDTERAYAAQTTALELTPGAPRLLVDRALTLAQAENYRDAIDDLTAALNVDPANVDALTYRAAAFRHAGDADLARSDIARALDLAPAHAPALLEKGILARMADDADTARAAWLAVIDAAPDSAEAETARMNIQMLDGG